MYRFCTDCFCDKRQTVDTDNTKGAARQSRQLNFNQYESYDYSSVDDDDALTAASDQLGSFDGHHKCDNGISICLTLTTLAGIAVLYYILFTRITMAGKRRRRRRRRKRGLELLDSDSVVDFILSGT